MNQSLVAYCGADGVLHFKLGRMPAGMLPIGRCTSASRKKRAKWQSDVQGYARRGWERGVFLVPGVPEASDQLAGLEALERFREVIRKQLGGV